MTVEASAIIRVVTSPDWHRKLTFCIYFKASRVTVRLSGFPQHSQSDGFEDMVNNTAFVNATINILQHYVLKAFYATCQYLFA